MEITASSVAELRNRTGAGMMDCKKALVEAAGDAERAIEILRIKGIAKAASKSDRKTGDGLVCIDVSDCGKKGVLIEVNCETDFVARTDDFKTICKGLVKHLFDTKTGVIVDLNGDNLLADKFQGSADKTVEEYIKEGIAKLGENMRVARYANFETSIEPGRVNGYLHLGGKAGVLVFAETDSTEFASSKEFAEIIEEIAIHICAFSPEFISPDEVPGNVLDKEKIIYREQALGEGKPEAIVDKIVMGRVNKYYSESCLLKQPYYKDDSGKLSVEDYIKKTAQEHIVTVKKFARFQLGN
jgi:elongation factor Ts